MQVIPLTSNIDKCYPCEAYVMIGSKKGKAMTGQIMTQIRIKI
ncbi:PemK-like growth inhibitor [Rickettsia rhipicephali str. 3-7-female6-CWPP]|uniref:PemK-like growth inhibitor n=1 Tax=Rickettsia rhipicephali (strain 3-7-female6-CWPP) TaxID=1105113 RepID=A0AAI8F805_RICR3|nr:PemK-like growth inhibitor [Rickettsia rhipicephali str. 3-7-female6-CWPP]